MAYKRYDNLWHFEFYNNVSAKDKMQDSNLNQLERNGNDTYRKDEKITTKFEFAEDEVVLHKAYLDTIVIRSRVWNIVYRKKLY